MRRLRPGDVLAGAAGALLVASLFATWYSVGVEGAEVAHLSAWRSFSVIDVLLALAGTIGVALALATAVRRTPALPVALGVLGAAAGALATLLVAIRLLDPPGPDEFVDLAAGAWLGLAGALGLTAGAWWSITDERNRGVPPVSATVRPPPPAGPGAGP